MLKSCKVDSQVVYSGFTAAAQYGLHLSVTHKPFRAATASLELQSCSSTSDSCHILCYVHTLHPPVLSKPHVNRWGQTFCLPKDVQMISSIFFSYILSTPKAGKEVHHLKHTNKNSLVTYFEVSLSKLQLGIQVQHMAKSIWTLKNVTVIWIFNVPS